MPQVGTFVLQPEHLDEEEITYELRIRREFVTGNKRQLSGKLRAIISQEHAGKREAPRTGYGIPSQELAHCEGQMPMLTTLLGKVDQDIISQNRFMTKFIHVKFIHLYNNKNAQNRKSPPAPHTPATSSASTSTATAATTPPNAQQTCQSKLDLTCPIEFDHTVRQRINGVNKLTIGGVIRLRFDAEGCDLAGEYTEPCREWRDNYISESIPILSVM